MSAMPAPKETAISDGELLLRIAAGELDALGELFERHERAVRSVLRRLGASAADVDDLVQVTFIDVMRAAPRFEQGLSARAWICGIAVMTSRRHRRLLRRAADRIRSLLPTPPSESRRPDHAHEARETAARVEAALQRLTREKREAFVLLAIEELRGEEVAIALGIPVATVWTRVHYARKELRAHLADLEGTP
jgi:RNA polymerase sigma factor (sigma-70 family)